MTPTWVILGALLAANFFEQVRRRGYHWQIPPWMPRPHVPHRHHRPVPLTEAAVSPDWWLDRQARHRAAAELDALGDHETAALLRRR